MMNCGLEKKRYISNRIIKTNKRFTLLGKSLVILYKNKTGGIFYTACFVLYFRKQIIDRIIVFKVNLARLLDKRPGFL